MKYSFTVYQQEVEGHRFWVAKSTQLSGCVGQGDNSADAIKELEENEIEWLDSAKEYNIPIPPVEVKKEQSYSGRYALRMSPILHERIDAAAKEQNVSMNHLICEAVAFYLGKQSNRATVLSGGRFLSSATS